MNVLKSYQLDKSVDRLLKEQLKEVCWDVGEVCGVVRCGCSMMWVWWRWGVKVW